MFNKILKTAQQNESHVAQFHRDIANRSWKLFVGNLKEGFAADVILTDYYLPALRDAATFLAHLAFGVSQSLMNTTIANGKFLVENRRLILNLNEERIDARSRAYTVKW
jgi:hypothetical protein